LYIISQPSLAVTTTFCSFSQDIDVIEAPPEDATGDVIPPTHKGHKRLIKATVNILSSICPTDDNCKLVAWRGSAGQHKMMFRIDSMYDVLPECLWDLPPVASREAFAAFLKASPRFTVVKDR
jgi:hypothetical protein